MNTISSRFFKPIILVVLLLIPLLCFSNNSGAIEVFGFRIEFLFFGLILISIALFEKKTFLNSILGLIGIISFKLIFDSNFNLIEHIFGNENFITQLADKNLRQGEWSTILNLTGLLLGFGILAKVFQQSKIPEILPDYLPNDWKGPFVLLLFIGVLSAFLDNIAAALIGGTIALVVFNKKVHIGYIVAIVAASNAGGAGSVIGDTTTTMMWIDGVSPLNVLHAFIASIVAILFFGYFASKQQDKFHRIQKDAKRKVKIDFKKLLVVSLLLIGAIISNFLYDMPALGVWIGLLVSMFFTKLPWGEIKGSIKGTIFLLCLVLSASMMPVETLPAASWKTAFSLGFISAIFDNIPLTKLCLEQGHFDWGILAYSVGFGGSMIWFGSSAGVAISNLFPEARNVGKWIKNGWHVIIAFILGFFTLYLLLGWQPDSNKKHKEPIEKCPAIECQNKKS